MDQKEKLSPETHEALSRYRIATVEKSKTHTMATFFERVWGVRRLVATHQNMHECRIDISSSVSETTSLTLNTGTIYLKMRFPPICFNMYIYPISVLIKEGS